MADTTALKNRIRAAIKANNNQEITGPVLQQTLLDIVDELDTNPELAAEINARESADTQLQQNINAETTRAEGAESTLQQNITAETTRAEGAESTLQQNITAETTRAQEAEQANASKLGYYVCNTAAATAVKTVAATGYALTNGGSMKIKMTNANTANDATLNINSTGTKALYYNGERASANNSWEAGETVEVYYDGTSFYANNVAGGSGDGAYDISAIHSGATYDNLAAALGTNGANVPASKRKGGMSVKYIQNIYATYSVVMTEELDTKPTGTELQSTPDVTNGTYIATQLSDFNTATLPTTIGNSVTYYVAVTGGTTTYTKWVVTKVTNDSSEYMQWRYTKPYSDDTAGNTAFYDVSNWEGGALKNVETNTQARYVYPTIFGSYIIDKTKLTARNDFWCTNPFLVKKGETVKTISAKYIYLAKVDSENLPLTPSTPITLVASSGNTDKSLSYTNNTDGDIYLIFCLPRNCFWSITISSVENNVLSISDIKGKLYDLKSKLSSLDTESIFVSNFNTGVLGNPTGTFPAGKVSRFANTGCFITTPIELNAGDTLHFITKQGKYLVFARIADGEEQTNSTEYDGVLRPADGSTHVILPVSESMRLVINYLAGDFVKAYVEHSTSEILTREMIYPTIADDCIVESGDSDICLIMGSSLTYNTYSPKTLSWIERVNDLVDIGVINGGHSGDNLAGNITDMTSSVVLVGLPISSIKPRYIVSNNDANGTPTGVDLNTQLKQFERVVNSVGATCLVCGEEPTLIDADKYHRQVELTKHGINYFPTAILWKNLNSVQSYAGWMDGSMGVHSNFKNGSSHVSMSEMLSQLYINKSVKFYKVRENYKNGIPTTAELVYNNNFERAAIWRGTCPAIGSAASPWANDNIDGKGYISGETPGVDKITDTVIRSEVMIAKGGGDVTFYKHALIEIITPRVQVSKVDITVKCSAKPTAVGYIKNGAYVAVTPVYTDGVLSMYLDDAGIQDYDKIRIIISNTTDATFTLGSVKAILKDGHTKPSYEVRYTGRNSGTELMTKTSVEDGWTMSGNASVAQLPTSVRNYTALNNVAYHIQLDDDNATASYTQQLDHKVHKVAVRIAATIFPPIQTVRTSNDYTTTAQNIFRGMYYGGNLLLTINDAYIPLHIETGWTEVYTEAVIDGNSLNITLGRATAFDADNYNVGQFPVFIHNVSVQEI